MSNEKLVIPGLFTKIFFPAKAKETMARIQTLQQPRIFTMPQMKVLTVHLKGYPGKIAGRAFGGLFSIYHRLGIGHRLVGSPRARFPLGIFKASMEQLEGEYALPVPESVKELPANIRNVKGLKVALQTWEYGEVAEILHVGPYSTEEATIKKLEDHLAAKGYKKIGKHEEEYHVGPGMFSKGNPDRYTTLIRFRVEKQGNSK